jgi:hypothetical protein
MRGSVRRYALRQCSNPFVSRPFTGRNAKAPALPGVPVPYSLRSCGAAGRFFLRARAAHRYAASRGGCRPLRAYSPPPASHAITNAHHVVRLQRTGKLHPPRRVARGLAALAPHRAEHNLPAGDISIPLAPEGATPLARQSPRLASHSSAAVAASFELTLLLPLLGHRRPIELLLWQGILVRVSQARKLPLG